MWVGGWQTDREAVMQSKIVVVALAAACALAHPAAAQEADPAGGWFTHEGVVEVTWDHADEADVAAGKIEYAASARIVGGLTAQAALTLEPVADAAGDSTFENEGAYVENLLVSYVGDAFTLYGGKFNPVFGLAAELAPGLYGAEIGEIYETTEKLGFGGDVDIAHALFHGRGGNHVLSASAFTADRSALSGSIGTKRPRLRLEDGGVGNTENLESWAVSLDGALPNGFGYTLGYRNLAAAQSGDADERGAVVGVSHAGMVGGFETELMAEAATLDHADGVEAARHTFYTLGGVLRRDAWHGSLTLSGASDNEAAGGADLGKLELSVGRDFGDATLDAGVQLADEDGEETTVVGLRFSWAFD